MEPEILEISENIEPDFFLKIHLLKLGKNTFFINYFFYRFQYRLKTEIMEIKSQTPLIISDKSNKTFLSIAEKTWTLYTYFYLEK